MLAWDWENEPVYVIIRIAFQNVVLKILTSKSNLTKINGFVNYVIQTLFVCDYVEWKLLKQNSFVLFTNFRW